MDKNEMLWDKFALSGKVDDYLNYRAEKSREEKADEFEHGRFDNQRKKCRGAK